MNNLITGIAHLGVQVTNIEKSSKFYQSLGFKVDEIYTKPSNVGEIKVIFLSTPTLIIELYELPNTQDLKRGPIGIDHISLEVSDLNLAMDQVAKLGYEINEGPVYEKRGICEVNYFLIAGPDNERVEFDQTKYFK